MARDRLRVALISFGFGEYCVNLANGLAQQAEVLLMLPGPILAPHMPRVRDGVRWLPFYSPRLRQPWRQLRMIRAIFGKLRKFNPDVVHYQGAHPWFDLAFPFLRRYPRVLTIHDFHAHPGDRPSRKTPLWAEMFARRRADALIVHTRHMRDIVTRELPRAAGNVAVIPHIQIGEQVAPPATREKERLILFFGRIWPYKGLEYLIQAEPWITSLVPDARILIAGEGEDFSRYARMMIHADRFIVHNEFISEERAAEYFARASVVVLPYIEASQSGVISMAYSAGKPVVATKVGGLPEMVDEGSTGYLVSPRDPRQLAEAVTRLLLDAPLRRQMGLNGKRKIETESSPGVVAQKTLEVYRRTMERTAQVAQYVPASAAASHSK